MRAAALRLVSAALAALSIASCTHTVTGAATRPLPGLDDDSRSPVDVDAVLLDQARMRAITGGGDDLTIIPSRDGKSPDDVTILADRVPPPCSWLFAETQTFGSEVEEFHKTTYQNPPRGALISQGAAGYRDAESARRALDGVARLVQGCDATASGYVGEWSTTTDAVRTRTSSQCGRDYRLKSAVLVEVTFCAYPASVPDIVMTNIMARIPG